MSHSSPARSSSSLAGVRKPSRRCKATTLFLRWSAEFLSILDRALKLYDIASAVEAALLHPGHDTLLAAVLCILLVLAEKCAEHILDQAGTVAVLELAAAPAVPLDDGPVGTPLDSIAWHRAHLCYCPLCYCAPATWTRLPPSGDSSGRVRGSRSQYRGEWAAGPGDLVGS